MSCRSNGESEHEISALGSFPGRVGAWISTASVSAPVLPGAERPEDRLVGRVVRVGPGLEIRDPVEACGHDLGELQPLGELEQRADRGGDRGRVLQLVLDAATDADDLFLRGAGEHVGTRALDRAEERTEVAGDRVQVAGQVRGCRGVGIGREQTEIGEQRVDRGHDRSGRRAQRAGLPLQVLRGVAQPLGVLRERRRDIEGLGHELRELVRGRSRPLAAASAVR